MAAQEYWTMFYYGSSLTICSKHRSLRAAERASCKCESRGNTNHIIARIEWCRRKNKVEKVTSHNKRKPTLKRSAVR